LVKELNPVFVDFKAYWKEWFFMGLRPGRCYSSTKDRAFSRFSASNHRKSYVGAIPGIKTRQFNMGNGLKDFSHVLDLIVCEEAQIRDNALESIRMTINRLLNRKLGKDDYFMKIRAYPFQILRENKQAQGAGADRVSQGMSRSFGSNIGLALRVRPGQKIISVLVDAQHVDIAKQALARANPKLGIKVKIRVGTDVASIGTKPKKTRDMIKEEEKKKEEEKAEAGAEEAPEEKKGKEKAAAEKKGPEEKKPEKGKSEEKKPEKGKK